MEQAYSQQGLVESNEQSGIEATYTAGYSRSQFTAYNVLSSASLNDVLTSMEEDEENSDRGNIEFLASALRQGLVKSKRSLDKIIEHASNKNAHEATAILLDYKDATFNRNKPAKRASKSKRPSLKL